jgi:hypothetical protein
MLSRRAVNIRATATIGVSRLREAQPRQSSKKVRAADDSGRIWKKTCPQVSVTDRRLGHPLTL